MNLPDALSQYSVIHGSCRGWSIAPGIEAAGRYAKDTAQGTHGIRGLVCHYEFEDDVDVTPLLPANQAVAFASMSRSICNCLTWRRSLANSSRSAVLRPSLLARGDPYRGRLALPNSEWFAR